MCSLSKVAGDDRITVQIGYCGCQLLSETIKNFDGEELKIILIIYANTKVTLTILQWFCLPSPKFLSNIFVFR